MNTEHTKRMVQIQRVFCYSAGAILLLVAMGKAAGAAGHVRLLAVADPVLGVRIATLMWAAVIAEMGVAVHCLLRPGAARSLVMTAWLGCCFLVYRLGLWWLDAEAPCTCLGSLRELFHMSSAMADSVARWVLAYLLLGSLGLLLCLQMPWRTRRELA